MPFSDLFLKGLAVGFLIAAPIGPIAVLCVRRTLSGGWLSGFSSGAGAAVADAIYGALAAFGVTFISTFIEVHKFGFRLGGGLLFAVLGVKTFFTKPFEDGAGTDSAGLAKAFISTLLLTLTNPMTVLAYAAVFTELGVAAVRGNYLRGLMLVIGVLLGSMAWWVILVCSAGPFKGKMTVNWMRWVDRSAGILILAIAVVELIRAAMTH